ncbi:hypothetical protein [Enterovibrio nigricans]|uniref:Uncharacterized protein n=1 Tax=Enterovibrio nigricans DSM 22720 TaxID=1121868 RepID=A0A1T4UAY5_9GAMM|nr:hypothetical protein [Enterovibrio nigricans]PKF51601.1 hypothetical protein AT251_02895 [Enterovibrio nigricans]SKA49884.1 hypothetical protein SAMN02745132_01255 [Enterovibrio nigricans DSM 22720]
MTWFPKISDLSPQKVHTVLKQDKAKQQQQKITEEEEREEVEQEPSPSETQKKKNSLLDIYI